MLIADCRCPTCGGDLPDTDLIVDIDDTNTAVRNGLVVTLTPQSAVLLWVLAKAAPRIVDRDTLIRKVWGHNEPEAASRAIDVRISRLRRDIEPLDLTIVTSRGTGYGLRRLDLFESERSGSRYDAAIKGRGANDLIIRNDMFRTAEISRFDLS